MRLKMEGQCKITHGKSHTQGHASYGPYGRLALQTRQVESSLGTSKGAMNALFNVSRHIDKFAIRAAKTICIFIPP